jgi:tRNA pseudouridine38-40 synthase
MRIAIKLAYNGKKHHGFARQPNVETVEEKIIKALIKNRLIEGTVESKFRYASRTDKGVSALCNVIAFNTRSTKKNILKDLSFEYEDIVFFGIKRVELEFNPRYAKLRIYRYYLPKDFIDIESAMTTAGMFTGEHDFSNFARLEPNKNPVRTINNIVFTDIGNFICVDFSAQTFLWHQIRRIIYSILRIETGKLKKDQIKNALNNPNKRVDFGLAPAELLILKDIIYDFDFENDENLLYQLNELEKRIINNLDIASVKPPKS